MQQHPLKLDAGSHNNGPGADAFALSLAKGLSDRSGNPDVSG